MGSCRNPDGEMCIRDRPIPADMVSMALRKASSPVSYELRYNWERVVSVACSLIKRQRKEQNKEEWNVAVDQECDNRNYLYGRLLAIADRICLLYTSRCV